jgi:hypothetical protein
MMELAEKYNVGIAKTANTNISGLWVKNADLPPSTEATSRF